MLSASDASRMADSAAVPDGRIVSIARFIAEHVIGQEIEACAIRGEHALSVSLAREEARRACRLSPNELMGSSFDSAMEAAAALLHDAGYSVSYLAFDKDGKPCSRIRRNAEGASFSYEVTW